MNNVVEVGNHRTWWGAVVQFDQNKGIEEVKYFGKIANCLILEVLECQAKEFGLQSVLIGKSFKMTGQGSAISQLQFRKINMAALSKVNRWRERWEAERTDRRPSQFTSDIQL